MTTQVKPCLYTIAEFMDLPDDGKSYELVKRELVEMPPNGEEHGSIQINLSSDLHQYTKQHKLGRVYPSDTTFVIDATNDTGRKPDVSFVAAKRLVRTTGAIPFAPDLAVEVVSPSDRLTEVEDKVAEYLQAGVKLIWVVNPRRKVVYVYRIGSNQRATLNIDDALDGEDVVPGFKLKVSALFE